MITDDLITITLTKSDEPPILTCKEAAEKFRELIEDITRDMPILSLVDVSFPVPKILTGSLVPLSVLLPTQKKTKERLWPKTEQGRLRWKSIFLDMCRLDKMYSEDLRKPTYKDYADFLAGSKKRYGSKGKPLSERILREIRRAGKEGYLK